MDVNKAIFLGRVATVPEQKTLPSGATITRLNIATNHAWKDAQTGEKKEKVDFHTIIGWNRLGETMQQYLKKGDRVYVEGRVDNRSFEGNDGKMRYFTDVVAQKLIMLGSKRATRTEDVPEEVTLEEVEA